MKYETSYETSMKPFQKLCFQARFEESTEKMLQTHISWIKVTGFKSRLNFMIINNVKCQVHRNKILVKGTNIYILFYLKPASYCLLYSAIHRLG